MMNERAIVLFYSMTIYGRFRYGIFKCSDYYLKKDIKLEQFLDHLISIKSEGLNKLMILQMNITEYKEVLSIYEEWDNDDEYLITCQKFCNVLLDQTIDTINTIIATEKINQIESEIKKKEFNIYLLENLNRFQQIDSIFFENDKIDEEILIPEIEKRDEIFFAELMQKLKTQSEENKNF